MKPHSFVLVVVLLLLLLGAACQTVPSVTPVAETLETRAMPVTTRSILRLPKESYDEKAFPKTTAVLWADGFLWTANESGLLTRWDVKAWQYQQYRLPGESVVRTLASDGQDIYAGTEKGDIWCLADDGTQTQIVAGESGWVSALTFDSHKSLWYADTNSHFDLPDSQFQIGQGLIFLEPGKGEKLYNLIDGDDSAGNLLKNVTALTFDLETGVLWVGTRLAKLLRYKTGEERWEVFNVSNSNLEDGTINDLKHAPDGSLWLATGSGVSSYRNGVWKDHRLVENSLAGDALSLAITEDNVVWVAGENYIACIKSDETGQTYYVTDNPLLSDRIRFVVLDDESRPWFIGRRGKIHFDGQVWIAYDADVRRFALFTPVQPSAEVTLPPDNFPPPTENFTGWLKTWPRPKADNGRGMHFLQSHQFDVIEAQRQVNRLKRLGVHWALVHYADHSQLVRMAPIFQEAGITVIWRPSVRPYETYDSWARDVEFLRSRGVAPYIQLYNEPSLAQEWNGRQPIDQEVYLSNLLSAARQVHDAGGYVGLQLVNPDWLHLTLQTMKRHGMNDIFDRLFFVPHLYGLNHPPEYDEDINSVLGFRVFAKVFEEEIGFVPIMIVGEGGWRLGEAQDNRYPAITEELHRNYHLAVFDWFFTGELANGEPLPDYFFAFCPWLISDPNDPAAWFDSVSGDRALTIEAIETMSVFRRKFSWDK